MLEWFRGHLERLNLEANILRFWHRAMVVTCSVSLIMQAAGWIVAFSRTESLMGRHGVAIVGFILTVFALIFNFLVLRWEPQMLVMISLQMLCLIALFMVASSAGTLAIVVDLCKFDEHGINWNCGAVAMEYLGAWVNCFCLCVVFGATQKRIIMLVDRGILNGIGDRSRFASAPGAPGSPSHAAASQPPPSAEPAPFVQSASYGQQ